MMKKIHGFLIILLFVGGAAAQSKKFVWADEICTFEGTYNAALYTETRLANTYRLYYSTDFDLETHQATAFNLEGIEKLRSVASLDEEYERKATALKTLEIVDVPFWKEFKQKKLKALARDHELARASVRAYENPSALREVNFAAACVAKFAPPLMTGGDSLLGAWREVNVDLRKKNADPESVRKNFEAQAASSDKFKYARVEVVTFGWWNCVNALIDRGGEADAVYKNFRKLFRRVRQIGCDNA